jgi:tetratricopeptide (TPR) repeat protein
MIEASMDAFYSRLDVLYQSGEPAAAEKHIRDFLDDLELLGNAGTPEYAAALNELAGYLRGASRYEESAAAFEQALEIMRHNKLEASKQYATILLNLAGLRRLTGETQKALVLFIEARDLLREADATDDYAYASVINNIALAYRDAGDYERAFITALESYELTWKLGLGDHEKATSLNNLAVICLRAGRPQEAEQYIDEALAVYNRMPEPNVHHAAALSTKASLLFRGGQYRRALDLFLRARELTERFFGRNIEYATSERSISMAYEALGETRAAAAHMKIALSLFESILGQEHDRTKDCASMLERLSAGPST